MTVLQNTVTEPDGTALDGWLDVAALGSPFRPGTQSEVLGPIKDRQFTGGTWSVNLVPGLYEVTQRRRDGAVHSRWTVQVPDAGSAWLADCLVTVPGTPASMALLGLADATVDGAGHLLLIYTDGSSIDAGSVAGPPGDGGGTVDLAGTPLELRATAGTYAPRPATTRPVHFIGPTPPAGNGSTAGGGGMVPELDAWFWWAPQ